MIETDAILLLRQVALALSHGAANKLWLSPTEQARLASDTADAIRVIAPALRTLETDDALRRLVAIAPASNVIPVQFGDHRP